MVIVPAYAVLFACLFLVLSVSTIRARRTAKVAIGVGGDRVLERLSRVHANFAEYVPFTLLLIAFAEMRGILHIAIHLLCLALLIGRLVHAWGVSNTSENFRFRVIGMIFTLNTIGATTLIIAVSYFI